MHSISKKKVLEKLNSSVDFGISNKNIEKIRNKYGFNKLTTNKKVSFIFIFLKQLISPLIIILIVAAIISFLFHEFIDGSVILFTILLNSIIGFIQEYKAEKTMESLKNMIVFECVVLRDGKKIKIRTEELVPGDIVFLEQGLNVPADCRILKSTELTVNESILTGESIPVNKNEKILKNNTELADRINMAYMGTSIVSGRAIAVVINIGDDTEIGKINNLIQVRGNRFPLQEKIEKITLQITIIIIFICLIIFLVGLFSNKNLLEMFLLSVSIAVSAIPEGLAIGVTVILAIGVRNILKNNALVRNLYSAQTLGSSTVICTDKTGTITEGKMFVDSLVLFNEKISIINNKIKNKNLTQNIKTLISIGINCNNSSIEENYNDSEGIDGVLGTPTENSILYLAYKNNLLELNKKIDEIPFNSDRKFMITLCNINKEKNCLYIKGAPEKIFEKCSFVLNKSKIEKLNSKNLDNIKKQYNIMASSGLRILGCAYKNINIKYKKISKNNYEKDLIFVGFFAIKDPLRKDSKRVINLCKKAGIKICILTGDNRMIATSIGKEIGLMKNNKNILDGFEIDLMTDAELKSVIKNISIFARVTPTHKLRIINALKDNGEVVAMTGDGVNDAPALKRSDIGIALGSGTDIAKESSDIVLLNDNLSNIINSIKQGRIIFFNIRKLSFFLLSDCFSGVILIIGSILMGIPTPLTASQILIANLIQDGLPAMLLSKEKEDFNFLKSKPISKSYNILNFELIFLIILSSLIMGLISLFSFKTSLNFYSIEKSRTFAFCLFSFISVLYIFSAKNLEKKITINSFVNNKALSFSVLISLLLQLFIVYNPYMNYIFKTTPLSFFDIIIIILASLFTIIFIEIIKYLFNIKKKNKF